MAIVAATADPVSATVQGLNHQISRAPRRFFNQSHILIARIHNQGIELVRVNELPKSHVVADIVRNKYPTWAESSIEQRIGETPAFRRLVAVVMDQINGPQSAKCSGNADPIRKNQKLPGSALGKSLWKDGSNIFVRRSSGVWPVDADELSLRLRNEPGKYRKSRPPSSHSSLKNRPSIAADYGCVQNIKIRTSRDRKSPG